MSKLLTAAMAALMALGLVALVPAAAQAVPARPALGMVDCNHDDYLWVYFHEQSGNPNDEHLCFANAGEFDFATQWCMGNCWLDSFFTGNNVVQFKGDNSWQPAGGVPKWVHYTFPNHPGGVDLQAIRIF